MINKEYMDWMENFTATHHIFFSKEWNYTYKIVSEKDRKNADALDKVYGAIEGWASMNFIEPVGDEDGFHYNMEHNNKLYEIGKQVVNGGMYWVRRTSRQSTEVIRSDEVINDVLRPKTITIISSMAQLKYTLTKLRDLGVSTNILKEEVKETLTNYDNGNKLDSSVVVRERTLK